MEAASAAEAGSQDGTNLGGRGLLIATGVSSVTPTGMATGPDSGGVGTGAVIGVDNGLNRDLRDVYNPDIGGSGPLAVGDALKPPDCGATGSCLVQEGIGVATGGGNGLDWTLEDDEESAEEAVLRRRRVDVTGNRGGI